jgi:hypothetical protein
MPTGRASTPRAQGVLSLVDIRGDDRLSVVERYAAVWRKDGRGIYIATHRNVLLWDARTGQLALNITLEKPLEKLLRVALFPDERWLALTASDGVRVLRTDGSHQRDPGEVAGPVLGTPCVRK